MSAGNKILIVDDDNRNIFALVAFLKAKGFSCLSAPGAAEALSLLEKDPQISIVLMDMMMPGMDGYEAIRHIRNNPRIAHLPLVAVTAQAMVGDKEKCIRAGADDYISKPVDVDALLHLLHHYLNI